MPSPSPFNFTGQDTTQTITGTFAVSDDGSGNFGTVTAQGVNLANGDPTPADLAGLSWTFDAAGVAGTKQVTAGTVYLSGLYVRANTPVSKLQSKIQHTVTTPATTGTANENFIGLYNGQALLDGTAAGTRIAVSGDMTTTWNSAGTFSPAVTWYSSAAVLVPGFYWVAVVANAPSVQATFRVSGGDVPAINGNLTAANLRCAVNGTGATSLPATITPASNSATNSAYFYAMLF